MATLSPSRARGPGETLQYHLAAFAPSIAAYRNSSFLSTGITSIHSPCLTRFSPPPCIGASRVRMEAMPRTSAPAKEQVQVKTERRKELAELIVEGPLFKNTKLEVVKKGEPARFEEWLRLGGILEEKLGEQKCDFRIYQYYLPIFFWIERELELHRASAGVGDVRPLIVGFSCPQGGGKTTMTNFISQMFAEYGRISTIASLDDFYVPFEEQQEIAKENPGNRLMQYRGMPGTHDLPLLLSTLDEIREFCKDGNCSMDAVRVPRFDKTRHGGRGDRVPREDWPIVRGTVDVMLLEGWCMGFEPKHAEDLTGDEELLPVNRELEKYGAVYDRLDAMLVIEIERMEWVFGWRLQAERATIAAGKPGLTDEQVYDFVSRFMLAYKHYSPGLYCRKTAICPGHELHIKIDQDRRPVFR